MIFKFIAGNTIGHALNKSRVILNQNKIPVINYAVENKNNKIDTHRE